jgi:hypothetical protein
MTMVATRAATEDHVDGRTAVHEPQPETLEFIVTTAFNVEAPRSNSGPSESAKIAAIVVLGLGLAGLLVLAGVTLMSLAIAFPIAIAVVDQYGLYASASDLALATQFSAYAPAFFVAGVAAFVASLVTIVKLIQRIDRRPVA